MHKYEFRIPSDDGKPALVASATYLNDFAAIRSARKIAGSRKVEIWRGMHCIYGATGGPVIDLSDWHRPEA
jgi:hypothetical protein